jgi:tetratricopeptide (TPR) repeat protein
VAICRQLDGLPLAIELAAARIKVLPPSALWERLAGARDPGSAWVSGSPLQLLSGGARDLPVRHQTLRDAIAWSYDLLSEGVKRLFRRLSVFVGRFALEAAEAVCADERSALRDHPSPDREDLPLPVVGGCQLTADEVLEGVASLLDQNLVRPESATDGEARYGILATIQAYGRELLEASGEAELLRRRHAEFFLALGEQAGMALSGPEQAWWLARLDRELGNVRLALDWALEREEAEIGLRLATSLWRFWEARGYRDEGRERLTALLALPKAVLPTSVRARALNTAAVLASGQGDARCVRALAEESLAIGRSLNNLDVIAGALLTLGHLAQDQGNRPVARACGEESLAIGRALGNLNVVAWSLLLLGIAAESVGDYGTAAGLYEESLAAWRGLGDQWGLTRALNRGAHIALHRGQYPMAERLYQESLAIRRAVRDRSGIAICHYRLAEIALHRGDCETARRLCEGSVALSREIGYRAAAAWGLNLLGQITGEQGDDKAMASVLAEALLLWRELSDVPSGLAQFLETAGWLAARQGEPERGARLFGAAEALRGDAAPSRGPFDAARFQRWVAVLGAALGEARLADAWSAGRTMARAEVLSAASAGLQLASEEFSGAG